jgi:magnesium-protoporphyrin O-methyltransferase
VLVLCLLTTPETHTLDAMDLIRYLVPCACLLCTHQQDKADAMISHLASLADQRLIISFAPKTPYYSLLKRIGELFPGPSKVIGWAIQGCGTGGDRSACRGAWCGWRAVHAHVHHISMTCDAVCNSFVLLQATRAYLHAEDDVEAALGRCGFKVVKREMTATKFYFSRLLEAVKA